MIIESAKYETQAIVKGSSKYLELIGYIFSGLCGIGYEGGKKAAAEYYRPCTLRIDRGTQLCLAIAKDIAKRDPTQVQLGIIGKPRSEEHTSELQSLMRISYAVFCLKKNI